MRRLESRYDDAKRITDDTVYRIWRLYMAGCVLGFDRNVVQLHQILGVKLAKDGTSGMPLRPDWEPSIARAQVAS